MIKRQASTGPVISASFHHNIVAQGNLLETLGKKIDESGGLRGEGFPFERIAGSALPSVEEEEEMLANTRGLQGTSWKPLEASRTSLRAAGVGELPLPPKGVTVWDTPFPVTNVCWQDYGRRGGDAGSVRILVINTLLRCKP